MMQTRVREALADGNFCRKLRGKIPKEALAIPQEILDKKTIYPASLLRALPAEHGRYCCLGVVAESMLQQEDMSPERLQERVVVLYGITISLKTLRLPTTVRFLAQLAATREKLAALLAEEPSFNPQVGIEGCPIVGHPDILCGKDVFEVKTTGQLKGSWPQFLMQTFCYAALCPEVERIHIVLPLSEAIWTWNVKDHWPKRKLFVAELMAYGQPRKEDEGKPEGDADFFKDMWHTFPIGGHVAKKKTMADTLSELPATRPFQVFFTRSTKFEMKDADVAQSLDIVLKRGVRMFIHSPYLLNLCLEPGARDNYLVECLGKHLAYANAMGFRGVVVHVGKACGRSLEQSKDHMKTNILRSLESASKECPLLLETPAGQGTELLTTVETFMQFVEGIDDERLGVCIDTCHVFAAGAKPLEYLKRVLSNAFWRKRIKLIHFNDSNTKCGSCVDRHARLGMGWVDRMELVEIAKLAHAWNIPMLHE